MMIGNRGRRILGAGLAALALVVAGSALSQSYPTRPITMLDNVPGGGSEVLKRAVLAKIKDISGATILYEGRGGGGGAPGLQAMKNAVPDGYLIGSTYQSALSLNPLIQTDLHMDPIADFTHVTKMWTSFNVWGARLDAPFKDVRDMVAAAKAKPESVKIGVFGAGNRFFVAQLEEKTGAKFLQIPYKGLSDALAATLGGQIDAHFDSPSSVPSYKGRAKVVLYGGAPVPASMPGVASTREIYGLDTGSWTGIVAPAKLPDAQLKWLEREFARALSDPKILQMIADLSLAPVPTGAALFASELRAEVTENRALVKKYPDIR